MSEVLSYDSNVFRLRDGARRTAAAGLPGRGSWLSLTRLGWVWTESARRAANGCSTWKPMRTVTASISLG